MGAAVMPTITAAEVAMTRTGAVMKGRMKRSSHSTEVLAADEIEIAPVHDRKGDGNVVIFLVFGGVLGGGRGVGVSARVASRKLKTKTKNFSELQMRVYNEIRKPLRSAHSAQAATGNYPHRALKAKRGLCLFK